MRKPWIKREKSAKEETSADCWELGLISETCHFPCFVNSGKSHQVLKISLKARWEEMGLSWLENMYFQFQAPVVNCLFGLRHSFLWLLPRNVLSSQRFLSINNRIIVKMNKCTSLHSSGCHGNEWTTSVHFLGASHSVKDPTPHPLTRSCLCSWAHEALFSCS